MMDTIAAIATASGKAGIAIVRVSGPKARSVLADCFRCANGRAMEPGRLTYGRVLDLSGQVLDEAMAVFLAAPHTYTREDVAEIQCHGGFLNARRVLSRVLRAGARLAEPGEFTRRAFENGRIDLSQAESVMALIGAKSQAAARAAIRQMEGGVSRLVSGAADKIVSMLALIEAGDDFPEEVDETASREELLSQVGEVMADLSRSLDEKRARMIRSGAMAALCGRPNTGKSSLMNALLEADRAIVTEIAGTTRDTLSETMEIEGLAVTLTDTAGQREALDPVEKIGVDRAQQAQAQADLVLIVLDGSREAQKEDLRVLRGADERCVAVLNKSDLPQVFDEALLSGLKVARVSAKTGEGIEYLRSLIAEKLSGASQEEALIVGERQERLCREALDGLLRAKEGLEAGYPVDVIAVDLSASLDALWSITGRNAREQVIDSVFTMFCVGK